MIGKSLLAMITLARKNMKFLFQTPKIIRQLYKNSLWKIKTNQPELYLTFDDGPIAELTPWVLDTLSKYGAKATFFCVGENVQKHTEIVERIIKEGHSIGNHTFNHLNGWKTKNKMYLQNVDEFRKLIKTKLFRPPYGKIKMFQFNKLKKTYRIVFWDVLSHDYHSKMSPITCLNNSIKYTRNGSIIVFHDNIKAENNLKYVLPRYIEHFLKLNYKFLPLKDT